MIVIASRSLDRTNKKRAFHIGRLSSYLSMMLLVKRYFLSVFCKPAVERLQFWV